MCFLNDITPRRGQAQGQNGSEDSLGQTQATVTGKCGEGSTIVSTVTSGLPSRSMLGAVAGELPCRDRASLERQHRALWNTARQLQTVMRVCAGAEERSYTER